MVLVTIQFSLVSNALAKLTLVNPDIMTPTDAATKADPDTNSDEESIVDEDSKSRVQALQVDVKYMAGQTSTS